MHALPIKPKLNVVRTNEQDKQPDHAQAHLSPKKAPQPAHHRAGSPPTPQKPFAATHRLTDIATSDDDDNLVVVGATHAVKQHPIDIDDDDMSDGSSSS